jgi:hypothetical protein
MDINSTVTLGSMITTATTVVVGALVTFLQKRHITISSDAEAKVGQVLVMLGQTLQTVSQTQVTVNKTSNAITQATGKGV